MAYKVLGMLKEGGLGKDMHSGVHVPYQSARTREQYRVSFQKGVLWWQFAPLDTSDSHNENYIYVMDGTGAIYTANKSEVAHHSAFLAGQPAAGAGHWCVKKGKVISMNSESGHYQPTADYCLQVIEELKKRGVPVDHIKKAFGMTTEQVTLGMKRLAGIKGLAWYQRETGGTVVKDYVPGTTTPGGLKVEAGSHIQGQRLRLYPGEKPKWGWF